jgi:hypothetical protein
MSKRYLVFAGLSYYAHGGWRDFIGSFDDLPEANQAGLDTMKEDDRACDPWYQIVDLTTGQIIEEKIYGFTNEQA